MSRLLKCLLVLAIFPLYGSLQAEDWAQFRGPNASGVSTESKNLPVVFSFEKNVLWKKTLGEGIACPIVVQGRVIATTMADYCTSAMYTPVRATQNSTVLPTRHAQRLPSVAR